MDGESAGLRQRRAAVQEWREPVVDPESEFAFNAQAEAVRPEARIGKAGLAGLPIRGCLQFLREGTAAPGPIRGRLEPGFMLGRGFLKEELMNVKRSFMLLLVFVLAIPLSAKDKKKGLERGLLEKMEAVPCGAKQKGITGLGTLWASAGITHVNSDEKLCPEYLLRTDQMDYEIRPTDLKHATLLPVGQEGEFKIKKNRMFLKFPEGQDRKMRTYEVVGMNPINLDQEKSAHVTPDEH
jgi:hypothetical protein